MTKEKTKPFVLRLDSATMAAVEKWAADEFRSTNGQLQWIVNEALRKARRLPKEGTEKLKPTIKLKVDDGEIAVLPFIICLF